MDVPVAPQTRPYLLAGLARARTIEHLSILERCSFVWMTENTGGEGRNIRNLCMCVWLKIVLHIGEMDMQRFLRNF